MNKWLKPAEEGIVILLHVIPNAKKTEIIGEYNNRLKVRICSPPVDGSANREIKNFFSKKLKISKSKIKIVKGERSKEKEILIAGIKPNQFNMLMEV